MNFGRKKLCSVWFRCEKDVILVITGVIIFHPASGLPNKGFTNWTQEDILVQVWGRGFWNKW